MRLEEGEIITLNDDGKDYVVVKEVEFNNKNYYYLMSAKKPVKILIVEFKVQDGREVIETVTDRDELESIITIVAE